MNQILDYNPNKNSGGKQSGSDKIVRVFAIILAIFAICLLAGGAYSLYSNQIKSSQIATQAASEAQISIDQKDTKAVIKVSHDKVIEKLIYSWDSEKETIIKGSGEPTMTEEISLFAGEHKLNIRVVDVDGHETNYEETITSENGEDKIYPTINFVVTDEKKLKITATDETAIDFVTYRWNDGEEVKVDEIDETGKIIEFEIEILKGNNDLTIIAVDKNNNTTTEPKSFAGVTKPDVKITISNDKKTAEVSVYHENGIKSIQFNGNDVTAQLKELTGFEENGTNADFTVPIDGDEITIKAVSVDETETEVKEKVVQEPDENIDISIAKSDENEGCARIIISTESGIKNLKLNINDMDFDDQLTGLYEQNPKDLYFDINLYDGNNKITVKVKTMDDNENEAQEDISK